MSFPPLEVVVALLITATAGATLLSGLVVANRMLRLIAGRLSILDTELASMGEATEPLTDRVAAIASNVARLKEAVGGFDRVLAHRAEAQRLDAEVGTP